MSKGNNNLSRDKTLIGRYWDNCVNKKSRTEAELCTEKCGY
jgi:hypothetical protein